MSESLENFLGLLIFLAFIGIIYYFVDKNKKKKRTVMEDIPVLKPVPKPVPMPKPPGPVPSPTPEPMPTPKSDSLENIYASLEDLLEFVSRTNYSGHITLDGEEVNPGHGPSANFFTRRDGSIAR